MAGGGLSGMHVPEGRSPQCMWFLFCGPGLVRADTEAGPTHWNSGLSTGSDWWALSWAMKNRLTPTEKKGKSSTLGVLSSCTHKCRGGG